MLFLEILWLNCIFNTLYSATVQYVLHTVIWSICSTIHVSIDLSVCKCMLVLMYCMSETSGVVTELSASLTAVVLGTLLSGTLCSIILLC